jgi:uncharacterized SAM-binding protein YcdF (DUF218 family)
LQDLFWHVQRSSATPKQPLLRAGWLSFLVVKAQLLPGFPDMVRSVQAAEAPAVAAAAAAVVVITGSATALGAVMALPATAAAAWVLQQQAKAKELGSPGTGLVSSGYGCAFVPGIRLPVHQHDGSSSSSSNEAAVSVCRCSSAGTSSSTMS